MLYSHSYRAFTLIELMIVIGIIGVLAAVIVPNFSKARQEAHMTSCQQNLKNLGTAYMSYKIRHNTITDLQELVDSEYIKSIPICPATGTVTYTIGQVADTDGQLMFIYCRGNNHKGMGARENYPRWYEYRGIRALDQNE